MASTLGFRGHSKGLTWFPFQCLHWKPWSRYSVNHCFERGLATCRSRNWPGATGLDAESIHYYEKQGPLSEPARRDNGYRDYAAQHLQRLSFIRHCRALDMPLADVNRLLGFVDTPSVDSSDLLLI